MLMRIRNSMTNQEFENIATELRPRLKTIGRQFFGDDDAAEDIAQETLMRLWMLREHIRPETGTETLAVRMAKNLCVSEWRKQKVRKKGALTTSTLTSAENLQQQLELREEVEQLRQAISRLKPAEQRLFRMRHEAEMDIQQIVAATGIGARSVSAMLSTAKRKLQEILIKKGSTI